MAPKQVAGVRTVLFVCLGNICRSPLAQGVFEQLLKQRGLEEEFTVGSCGIGGWHAGERPDPRTFAVAEHHGVELCSRARQLDPAHDFKHYDLLLAMDRRNLRSLIGAGCPPERAALFLSFAPEAIARKHDWQVPDPYDGNAQLFEEVYRLVVLGAKGLLEAVLA